MDSAPMSDGGTPGARPESSRLAPRDSGARGIDARGGVTARAVLTGIIVLLILTPVGFYIEVVWLRSGEFMTHAPAVAPVATLLLLTALMRLPLLRRAAFTRQELLVVYSIVIVGAPLNSLIVLGYQVPKVVIYYYLARANPSWESIFLRQIPAWWGPSDPNAVEAFFVGKSAVPWGMWLLPTLAWSSVVLAFFTACFCVLVLFQRQWVTHERLTFPQAEIPLRMVAETGAGRGALPRDRVFWVGVTAALLVTFASNLSSRVPALPALPLNPVLGPWADVGPLAGLGALTLYLHPWVLGLAYLVQKEVSFSCWFFWVVRLALTVAAIAMGRSPGRPENMYDSAFPAFYFQGTGAVIALSGWALWTARGHLRHVVKAVIGRGTGSDDVAPLYRWCVLGLVVSGGWLVYFCYLSGCRPVFGLALMGLIAGSYVIWSRLRAEAGVGDIEMLGADQLIGVPFGTGILRPSEIITFVTMRWASFAGSSWTYGVVTQNALETFKIADVVGLAKRRLAIAVLIGFVVSLLAGEFVFLTGFYHFGYFGTAGGVANFVPSLESRHDGADIVQLLATPSPPDHAGLVGTAAGAIVVILLALGRLRFWWWPFHPIGYIAACAWDMNWYFVPFVIGWAAKVLVVRYGGLRLYRRTVSLAVGLIVGEMANGGLWAAIALATQGRV
jgi:hypothetical protein